MILAPSTILASRGPVSGTAVICGYELGVERLAAALPLLVDPAKAHLALSRGKGLVLGEHRIAHCEQREQGLGGGHQQIYLMLIGDLREARSLLPFLATLLRTPYI